MAHNPVNRINDPRHRLRRFCVHWRGTRRSFGNLVFPPQDACFGFPIQYVRGIRNRYKSYTLKGGMWRRILVRHRRDPAEKYAAG